MGSVSNGLTPVHWCVHCIVANANCSLVPGNLPTEKVTKRDIFHRFYRHGKLAQISIKQAYGFVQFLDSESCRRALDTEQGQAVRGRKMREYSLSPLTDAI